MRKMLPDKNIGKGENVFKQSLPTVLFKEEFGHM